MGDDLNTSFRYDERKYRENYTPHVGTANQPQLAARLVFSAHSLEKSLSNENFELGHGLGTARKLVEALVYYRDNRYDRKDPAYESTLAVLREFHKRHIDSSYIDEIEEILADQLPEIKACTSDLGGAFEINTDTENSVKNFKDLSEGRYSVRSFEDRPMDRNDIAEVVGIAMKSPTVCNRQPVRVRAMYDKAIIDDVLKIQSGFFGYPTPPCLLLITSDDNSYIDINERNQGFIDGGLFAMSMLYALEYKNIGACPLNSMFYEYDEKKVRQMLNIPEAEKFITFIACGYFNKKSSVCRSFRYPIQKTLIEVTELNEVSDIKPEPMPEYARVIQSQTDEITGLRSQLSELEVLKAPSIKLAFRKFLGALRRRIRRNAATIRSKSVLVKRKVNLVLRKIKIKASFQGSVSAGAIITLSDDFNYGNVMQRYALQKFLQKNGLPFTQLAHHTRYLASIREKHFDNSLHTFVEQYIPTVQLNEADLNSYSNYIVGSDQVWRNHGTDDLEHDYLPYWFDFIQGKNTNRIAYAASFGVDNLPAAQIDDSLAAKIRPLLKAFGAVSVRERSGEQLVRDIAREDISVTTTLDPTLLLDKNDYSQLVDASEVAGSITKPVFCYVLDVEDGKKEIIENVAASFGGEYEVISASPDTKLQPTEAWLKGFRDAKCVVTDSFHGAVFSVVNRTDFIILANRERGLARVENLLEVLGIAKDRLVFSDQAAGFDYAALTPIDWRLVTKRLNAQREESMDWLLGSIMIDNHES